MTQLRQNLAEASFMKVDLGTPQGLEDAKARMIANLKIYEEQQAKIEHEKSVKDRQAEAIAQKNDQNERIQTLERDRSTLKHGVQMLHRKLKESQQMVGKMSRSLQEKD